MTRLETRAKHPRFIAMTSILAPWASTQPVQCSMSVARLASSHGDRQTQGLYRPGDRTGIDRGPYLRAAATKLADDARARVDRMLKRSDGGTDLWVGSFYSCAATQGWNDA